MCVCVCVCVCVFVCVWCVCEKDYIWNPVTCSCKNGKYLASITGDSVIKCDEILDTTNTFLTKTILTDFNDPKISISYSLVILLTFLLTIALLIAVSIYCYLIKY